MRSRRILLSAFLSLSLAPIVSQAEHNIDGGAARSLDAQVQALKKEIVDLNKEMTLLEEEVMVPDATQVNIFLSLDIGDFFTLESVKLKLDDKVVASHLYTPLESAALVKGAVQRLHMGSYSPGKHDLVAVFTGKGPRGVDYSRAANYTFQKGKAPAYLDLKVTDVVKKLQPDFKVSQW